MSIRSLSIALLALAALSACGLRGPLYLPEDKQAAGAEEAENGNTSGKSRRPQPAPQSQKRDRDGDAPVGTGTPSDPDRPATVPVVPPGN